MKRVLMVRSNPIEPDSRVEKEANSLCKKGYKVTLLGWDRSSNYVIRRSPKELANYTIEKYCIGAKAGFGEGLKSLLPFSKFQICLFLWILKNGKNIDIFHFCDFDTAFTGSIACRLIHRPYIFDIFDYLSTDANAWPKKVIKSFEDNVINRADATIICTEKRKQQIAQTNPKNLTVIHNSPPVYNKVKSTIGGADGRVRLCYVGILQDYRLIDEMLQVVSENNNIELHIGGFGKLEQTVIQYAEHYENIKYYGKLSYDQTLDLEQSCDIMTAIYAPYIGNHIYAAPNKFYEALMLGKPLVMVKDTGMSEYISQYDIGELIGYSKDSLEKGIQKLCDRRSEWRDISYRMKELYLSEFSWDEMEKRLWELYGKL